MPWGRRAPLLRHLPEQQGTLSPHRSGIKWLRKQSNCSPCRGHGAPAHVPWPTREPTANLSGGPRFRHALLCGQFHPEELRQAVELCHRRGWPSTSPATPCPATTRRPACQVAGVPPGGRGGRRYRGRRGVLSLLKKHAPGVKGPYLHPGQRLQLPGGRRLQVRAGGQPVILAQELSLDEIRRSGQGPRRWSWRPSSTGPCASATPAAACCPTT